MSVISLMLGTVTAGLLCTGPCQVKGINDVPPSLDGAWAGDGLNLVLDAKRFQANTDPDRPFDWRPFVVLDVTGSMVVFDIGPSRYIALLSDDGTMRLTKAGSEGQLLLRHDVAQASRPLRVRVGK